MGYIMEDLTVNEMEAALRTTRTVVLPVGVVEQHGYHLPLKTDTIAADELSKRATLFMNAVVAPTIPYCYSGGELAGTINISPQVFSLLVTDICLEFARMGFVNVILFLGHGGYVNTEAVKESLELVIKRNKHLVNMSFSIVGTWELSASWQELFNLTPEHDIHAGWAETSLMMYLRPDLVRKDIVMDSPEVCKWSRMGKSENLVEEVKIINHPYVLPRIVMKAEWKVGVTGFPERATRELGEKICNEVVQGLADFVNLVDRENPGL